MTPAPPASPVQPPYPTQPSYPAQPPSPAHPVPETQRGNLAANLRRIAPLAWPVFIGQVSVLAFTTVDTVLVARHAVPSSVMRRQTLRFSAGLIPGQSCTSSKLRPQPLHTSSPWLVEQIAMQGASGVVAYQASQAALGSGGMLTSSHSVSR